MICWDFKYFSNNDQGITSELSSETLKMQQKISNFVSTGKEFFKTLDNTNLNSNESLSKRDTKTSHDQSKHRRVWSQIPKDV